MSEKIKNRIFIAANCISVITIILLVIFDVAHSERFLYFILLLFFVLNIINCIFIKDYRAIFACTIVYEILPVLGLVAYGNLTGSIGEQLSAYLCLIFIVLFAIWSAAVTVYKSIRHKGKY